MNALRLAPVALVLGVSVPAGAETPFPSDDGDFWNPEVVTPTGNPTRISETPSATYVITGDEIRRSGAASLPELLRRVPGLEVRTFGASDAQVGARGFAYDLSLHVLVLVDGLPSKIDFFGGMVWETLALSALDIDRIEVVLGPGAAVYGNSAMLGTINVITRAAADYPRPEAEVHAGARGELRGSARYGVVRGPWRARTSATARRLHPFPHDAAGDYAMPAASGTAQVGYSPSPTRELRFEAGLHHGITEANALAVRLDAFVATLAHGRADARLGLGGPGAPGGEISVLAAWHGGWIRSETFPGEDGFATAYHTAHAEAAHNLQYTLADLPMRLRWGGELRVSTLESTMTAGEQNLVNVAAFASNEVLLDRLRLTAGLRVDTYTLTDVMLSPRLSAVWAPSRRHQVRLAYNQGYKNPSMALSFADFETLPGIRAIGNPELKPEEIRYAEAGYGGVMTDHLRVFANVFSYRFLNFHARNVVLADGELHYINNPPLDGFGGEAGAQITFTPDLTGHFSYAHVRLVPHDDFPYRADNVGSPRHKIGGGVSWILPLGAYVTLDGQYFGASQVDRLPLVEGIGREPVDLDPFLVAHARAGYRLGSGLDLSVAGTLPNLLGIDAPTPLGRPVAHFPGAHAPPASLLFRLAWYP